jgi:hypothetical protein
MGMPQGSGGLIMEFPSPSEQWNYLTHSWELGLQTPGHIHTPVGHAYRASRGLVSSEILWFCLEPQSIQLPSTTSRRFPYLGHIGLNVWEAIIGEEGLRTRLPFSQQVASQWWSWKRTWQANTVYASIQSYLVVVLWCTEEYATTANYRMQIALE